MPSNYEKPINQPEQSPEALAELGREHSEKLRDRRERVGEVSPEQHERDGAQARHEALENAIGIDKEASGKEKAAPAPATRRGSIKHERDASYKRTMTQIQTEMSPSSRAFSKVIHHKAVEKTSEALGATIARPNAILAGAVAAFIITLITYLVAKHFGYPLSGFETIGAFIVGWVLGILYDYFYIMITGKRSN